MKRVIFTLLFLVPIIFIHPDLIIAYVSFLAIIVALFREKLSSIYLPPILELTLADSPNYFSEVPVANGFRAYIGLILKNNGTSNAKNVMVLFNAIESSIIPNFKRYQSLPLIRGWCSPDTIVKSLPPDTPIRFSVGYTPDYDPDVFDFEFVQIPNELHLIKCPINQKTTFKFEARAISDNSNTASAVIEIEFRGNYTNGLKMKLIK